jgi:hypothetical protein
MEIIVPAAGLSSRFPDSKPKYLLVDSQGKMMLYLALQQFLNNPQFNITVGVLQEHDEKYNATEIIHRELGDNVNVVILQKVTAGPAETAMKIIEMANLDLENPVFIKDCDSYFTHEVTCGNYVCISKVHKDTNSLQVHNKSFVVLDEQEVITHIVEKSVVSDSFCVGGYKFDSVQLFRNSYLNVIDNLDNEIYVSHIIEFAISMGNTFFSKQVDNYVDVGTKQDWDNYNAVLV